MATFNCDKQLWERFKTQCHEAGRTATATLVGWIQQYLNGNLEGQIPQNLDHTLAERIDAYLEAHLPQYLAIYLEDYPQTPPAARPSLNPHPDIDEYLEENLGKHLAKHLEDIYKQLEQLQQMSRTPTETNSLWEENKRAKEQLAQAEELQQKLELLKEWVMPNKPGNSPAEVSRDKHSTAKTPSKPSETRPRPPQPVSEAKNPTEIIMPDGTEWRPGASGNYEIVKNPTPQTLDPEAPPNP